MQLIMNRGTMILVAVLLDLILGERLPIPHPVVIIGKEISFLEKHLLGNQADGTPLQTSEEEKMDGDKKNLTRSRNPRREFWMGLVLAVAISLSVLIVTVALLTLCGRIHPVLRFAVETFLCYECVAIRGMVDESKNVFTSLRFSSLAQSRQAVGRIVGRDTSVLDNNGIIRATVETVAEGLCDGVIAPLFYMAFGGATLGLVYKSINTMDSMVGYRNEKYLHFGKCAAKLDDGANYFPARISAMLLLLAGWILKGNAKEGFRMYHRDRFRHASPNSGQTESVMAGLLGIRLLGPAVYFGQYYDKPYIGDAKHDPTDTDILLANRYFLLASFIGTLLFSIIAYFLWR